MGESAFRLVLGESWDVVEVVRSLSQAVGLLTADVASLQKVVASQEARLQVLEVMQAPRPLITVGDLVAEPDSGDVVVAAPKAARVGKK